MIQFVLGMIAAALSAYVTIIMVWLVLAAILTIAHFIMYVLATVASSPLALALLYCLPCVLVVYGSAILDTESPTKTRVLSVVWAFVPVVNIAKAVSSSIRIIVEYHLNQYRRRL